MKKKDIETLIKGDKIIHKHYGTCTVIENIIDFGIAIYPDLKESRRLLSRETGITAPLLETSFKLILTKVNS